MPAFLHFPGKLLHSFLRDNAGFATGKGSAVVVEHRDKFCPLPLALFPQSLAFFPQRLAFFPQSLAFFPQSLAFFPQSKGLLHGVLFRVQPSGFHCAARESLLIWGKLYVHRLPEHGNAAAVRQRTTPPYFSPSRQVAKNATASRPVGSRRRGHKEPGR